MKVWSMESEPKTKSNLTIISLLAIFVAIFFGYILIGVFHAGAWLLSLVIEYWWIALLTIVGLLIIKKYFGKKKHENQT